MSNYLQKFDEIEFNTEWSHMISIAAVEKFDMKKFKLLAKETYLFLLAFEDKDYIEREYLSSIRLLYAFTRIPFVFLNKEGKAAVLTINSLLDMFEDNHLQEYIPVMDKEGNTYLIDCNTFDLSEMLFSE